MDTFTNIRIQSKISFENLLTPTAQLVLTNLEQTPPHCSLLSHQFWYSLNYQECKINIPAQTLYKILTSKNTSAVFLELNIQLQIQQIQGIYAKYNKIDFQNSISCISPIKDILNAHQIKIPANAFLFEMIEILYQYQQIKTVRALNYNFDTYKLKHYSSLPISYF